MTLDLRRAFDAAAIADLMDRFLRAVSFECGAHPMYGDLADLFIAAGRLIRNSGPSPEVATVDEFVRERQRAFEAGELVSFKEAELSDATDVFGNIAHRLSPYSKRAVTSTESTETRGVISTQFVRTRDGWRISSMAWDDEREGLEVPHAPRTSNGR